MTFPLDTSPLDINPTSQYINLLTFTWAGGAVVVRYCAADKPYNDGTNTYAEVPTISIDYGKQTGGVADEPVKVLMPPVDPVATMLVGFPFSNCTCLIEEVDRTENVSDSPMTTRRNMFFGTVSQCTGNKNGKANQCEVVLAGMRSFLDYPLGIPALNTCAWQFGDKNCALQSKLVHVASISGNTLALGAVLTLNDYVPGFASYGGIIIPIVSQGDTTHITLASTPPAGWATNNILIYKSILKLPSTVSAIISAVTGNIITIATLPGADDYSRGFLTYAGISLLIRSQQSTTSLEVFNPPPNSGPNSWIGANVLVTPGCRKNVTDCSKWANLLNFGGFGIGLQAFHPQVDLQ